MPKRFLIISIVIVAAVTALITAYDMYRPNAARLLSFRAWMKDPASHPDWKPTVGFVSTYSFHFRPVRSSDQTDPKYAKRGRDPRLDHIHQKKNSGTDCNDQTNREQGFVYWTILSLRSL